MDSGSPPLVLVVGGSGYVAGLVLHGLAERYSLRVFDRQPPNGPWEFTAGDVTDPDALSAAMNGVDLLLYMAMGQYTGGEFRDPSAAAASFDVNAKGLYLALATAARAGVKRAVYTSSLSVHDGHDLVSGEFDLETVPPEPRTLYGFTKWLGEEVCRYANRVHGMPVVALRLFKPVSAEQWHGAHDPNRIDPRTSAPDLVRALDAALALGHPGFEVIHVTGDTSGRAFRHEKAKRLLGWQPEES